MKTQKKLTEELNRGRTLMGLKPLTSKDILSEQIGGQNTMYHEWFDCSNALFMGSGIRYWDRFGIDAAIAQYGQGVAGPNGSSPVSSYGWYMGAPAPYNIASQNPNNGTLQTYATHQNSEAFYIGMGSPAPGTTLKYTSMAGTNITTDYCLEYLGPVSVPSTGNHSMHMGTMAMSNIVGPYGSCQLCQMGVLAPTYNCVSNINGNFCVDPGDGSGTYQGPNAMTDCTSACIGNVTQDYYRCHDCNTPCSQTVVDAGHCPYSTTQDCLDQCAESNKWTCGMPDKFGNPRCRKCREFELWDGTTCYNTKAQCLASNCPGKLPADKTMDIHKNLAGPNTSGQSKKKGDDLPKLDSELGDKGHLEQLISSMQSVNEFISWFDQTYGPFRKAGADIPTGQEVVSSLEETKGRISEQGLPIWMGIVGGIFGLITAGIKAWQSVQGLCCPEDWFCCVGRSRPTGDGVDDGETMGESRKKIRIKESDITNIVRKLIKK